MGFHKDKINKNGFEPEELRLKITNIFINISI
jgi:hypothetical protein